MRLAGRSLLFDVAEASSVCLIDVVTVVAVLLRLLHEGEKSRRIIVESSILLIVAKVVSEPRMFCWIVVIVERLLLFCFVLLFEGCSLLIVR